MSLSPQWLDELRARVTLSGVIGRTTKLQKAGREFKACCPFHNEKSPSFTVNDQKGFYHCFGCGAHGDVIRWMTDQRGLGFMDAVKELAQQAGLEMPAPDPVAAKRAEQRAGLHDVTQAAQNWFAANLAAPDGADARAYLQARGFDPKIAARFGFGLAPDSHGAIKQALGQFSETELIDAGLLISVDDKPPYDRFRGRLMLPIEDARGRVIAFGGRILARDTKAPKYLNSPDTPLFDKGRTLYNLGRAGPASRQTDRIVVVEGYMDVIALAAAGIEDAIAPLGTALTETQIEMLWRLVDVPILCFDGDAAGQRAAIRAATRALPLLRPGHSLQLVHLPAGLDPDDLIKRDGKAAMEKFLASPKSLLDTLWEYESAARPLNSPEDKAGLKQRLLDSVETIQHPDIRALYRRELMDRFSAYAFPPRQRQAGRQPFSRGGKSGAGFRNNARPVTTPDTIARLRKASSGASRDMLAAAVIIGLARYPDQIARHGEALARLARTEPALGEAVDILIEAADTLEPAGNAPILQKLGASVEMGGTRFSFLADGAQPQTVRDDLSEAVGLLVERPALEKALAAATARFDSDPEGAFAEQQRLLKRKLAFERRLGQMASTRAAGSAQETAAPAQAPARDEQELD